MLRTLQKQIIDSSNSTTQLLSSASIDAIISSDIATIDSLTSQLAAKDEFIYVRIKDEDNKVLSQAGDSNILNKEFIEDTDLFDSRNDGVFDTYKEVMLDGTYYGRVEIGISTKSLVETVSNARNTTLLFALVGIIFAGYFSFLLGKYLSSMLSKLESAALEVSHGELGYQIEITSDDELGRTAAGFNSMSQQIKRLYDSQIETNKVLDTISRAQQLYIQDSDHHTIFSDLLESIIELTESEMGFIAEVLYDDGKPFLRTFSMTDVSWDAESKKLYDENDGAGIEFRDLTNILGIAIEKRSTIISNAPSEDPRYRGLPENHLKLHSFAEIPIFLKDKIIAVIGLANRENGYNERVISRINPLNNLISNLYDDVKKQAVINSTQKKLNLSNERFTLLTKGTDDGIWDWDINTAEIYFSPRWYEMLGYDIDEFPASFINWQEIIHNDDLGIALDSWSSCMSNETSLFSFEYRLKTKLGRYIWVECRGTAINENSDTDSRMVGSHSDITSRKKNEIEISRAAQHTRAILDNVIDGIISSNDDNQILDVNPAICRIFDYSLDVLIGNTLSILMTSQSYNIYHKCIDQLQTNLDTTANNIKFEIEGIHANGDIFPIEVSLSKVINDDETSMYVSVVNDITERKNAERAILLANESALETERTKSAFMANMSHEIRTPMHGILGMLQILNNTKLNLDQREYIKTAKNASDDLLRIIDDVLDFSKIESGKLDIENVEFDLREIIDGVISLLTQRARKKNIELEQILPVTSHTKLIGDPQRIRQVLINLIGNALKFTKSGSIVINTRSVEEDSIYSRIRFEVSDTGIGIPQSSMRHLFESFRQADVSMSRKYGGTGLGLTISKQLVELMGGTIGVTSVVNEGSTFWFEILFEKNLFEKVKVFPTIKGKTALIINHSNCSQTILMDALSSWGVNCDIATDFDDALNSISVQNSHNTNYNYIFSSFEDDFDEFTKFYHKLRKDPAHLHTRIVYITYNMADIPTLDGTTNLYYLSRPFRLPAIYDSLTMSINSASDSISSSHEITSYNGELLNGHILLVEDNPVNQDVSKEMLKRIGLDVDIACNGKEALSKLMESSYDIVLMDCQMPDIDGFTVTSMHRQYESDNKLDHTTIIALTANTLKGDRERCIQAGMDDYLPKPFHEDMLGNKLQTWLIANNSAETKPILTTKGKTNSGSNGANRSDIIDSTKISELRELFGDNFNIIISKFIDTSSKSLVTLKSAVEANDMESILKSCHFLKGSSANIGALIVHQLCSDLEIRIREDDEVNIEKYFKDIETAFIDCKQQLQGMS